MPLLLEILPRLSERNCIEIVAKLVEEKKLDVVHTLDGKEYITPSQISREIRDELYVHGGQLARQPSSDSNTFVVKEKSVALIHLRSWLRRCSRFNIHLHLLTWTKGYVKDHPL